MSKVKITGDASGTGVFTIAAPGTNNPRTITLPDATGTLLNSDGDGSSLTGIGISDHKALAYNSAALNNVWGNSTTYSSIQMNTERFDTGSEWNTTNDNFTATVGGKYLITLHLTMSGLLSGHSVGGMRINTSNENYNHYFHPFNTSTGGATCQTLCVVADVDASDVISFQAYASGSTLVVDQYSPDPNLTNYISITLLG
jgi:hypothetical protein